MAIKGLTDRSADSASFPEIGKLKKGGKRRKVQKKDKKTRQPMFDDAGKPIEIEIAGEDLDYFRFETKDRLAEDLFHRAYGDRPTEINCFLPLKSAEECFYTCKEDWLAGGLVHRCDGEIVSSLRVTNKQGKSVIQRHFIAPVPCPGGCKEIGRLKVIIPELKRFAYVTLETHSINDLVNLDRQLKAAEMTFGQLTGIPFVLRRSPMDISCPTDDGKRARREKWMLSIEVDPAWAEPRLKNMRQQAIASASSHSALLAGSSPAPLALPSSQPIESIVAEVEPLEPSLSDEDRSRIVEIIGSELKRLKWTRQQGSGYLLENYGVKTRAELSDSQLLDFVQYLSEMPTQLSEEEMMNLALAKSSPYP